MSAILCSPEKSPANIKSIHVRVVTFKHGLELVCRPPCFVVTQAAPAFDSMFSSVHLLTTRLESLSCNVRQCSTKSCTLIIPSWSLSILFKTALHKRGFNIAWATLSCNKALPSVNKVRALEFKLSKRMIALLDSFKRTSTLC